MRKPILLSLIALGVFARDAVSQMSAQADLKMAIVDPTGARIPNAEIMITDDQTKHVNVGHADPDGHLRIKVPYCCYHIVVSSPGFTAALLSVASGASDPVSMEIMLAVSRGGSPVDVTPAPFPLETESDHLIDLLVPSTRVQFELRR